MKIEVEDGPSFVVDPACGQTLLDVLEEAGVRIVAACGGFAACSTCRIAVLRGAEGLTPLTAEEEPFIDQPGQRLACCCEPVGDIILRLEPGS